MQVSIALHAYSSDFDQHNITHGNASMVDNSRFVGISCDIAVYGSANNIVGQLKSS